MLISQFRKATISTIRLLLIYYVFSDSSGLTIIMQLQPDVDFAVLQKLSLHKPIGDVCESPHSVNPVAYDII